MIANIKHNIDYHRPTLRPSGNATGDKPVQYITIWSLKNGNTFYSNSNYVALRNYYAVSSTSAACNTVNSLIIAFRGTETRDIVLLTCYSRVKAPGCTASIGLLNKTGRSRVEWARTVAEKKYKMCHNDSLALTRIASETTVGLTADLKLLLFKAAIKFK